MATELKPVDVVLVGVGWTGGILAKELAQAGLKVVGLERGEPRDTNPDFQPPRIHDELRYAVYHELMQDLSRETISFRNNLQQRALPMRQQGSFLLGEGVGGSGVHWNGVTWRFLPWDFRALSATLERYGRGILPEDATVQDWGVTYEELEPYYDRFEYTCGIGGKAGNLKGQVQPGGNPFEGPRSREYPNPPMKVTRAMELFRRATAGLGFHPFVQPSANMTRPYTNPDGVQLNPCVYCGFCERFGCEVAAKSSPQVTVLPVAAKTGNFELRTHCNVVRVNLSPDKKRAVSVTYVDLRTGLEYVQPAELICLTSYVFNNVKLMLLSGIGQPYDPVKNEGVVGRNYAYQGFTNAGVFFDDKIMNSFMGAGALGMSIDDFNGDNFDHSSLGFIGGANIAVYQTGARPILSRPVPPGTPRWGPQWKQATARYYNRFFNIGAQGGVLSYRGHYLDLDPTYKDAYGLPLLRLTFDWGPNEIKASQYLAGVLRRIVEALKPSKSNVSPLPERYGIVTYQSTHNTGGAVMGADPKTSAVNRYLQSWDVPNVFVVGASAFPQNAGYNPTGTVGALAYWAADAIKNRYLKNPGPLVS